jgi:hypothetical protein
MHLAAKIVAAVVIVLVGAIAPASADPGGWGWGGRGRGRGRSYRGRSYRHWDRGHDYNPLPGFIGGVFGGWLGSQLNRDRDEDDRDDLPESRLGRER